MDGFFKALLLFWAVSTWHIAEMHIQKMVLFPFHWETTDAVLGIFWLIVGCIIAAPVLSNRKDVEG